MANSSIYITGNTISETEITNTLSKGKRLLADLAITAGYEHLYAIEKSNPCVRVTLYLYLYALESWVTGSSKLNYMTNAQLVKIMSEIEQLFCSCQVNADC